MKIKKSKFFENIFLKYQKYGYFEVYTAIERRAK